jgi:V/A-type H+-transporting ATPase subunit A
VSPPAGDFSEPVTTNTRRSVRTFWALDRGRAQARFFPAIDPLQSYSADVDALAHWWQAQGNPEWTVQRRRLLGLLDEKVRLERLARIVGTDSLPPAQQLTLLCAELVEEGVLRQSSFSVVDRYCSPKRQTAILAAVIRFLDLAQGALEHGASVEAIAALPSHQSLRRLGEEFGEDRIDAIAELRKRLDAEFASLHAEPAHAG